MAPTALLSAAVAAGSLFFVAVAVGFAAVGGWVVCCGSIVLGGLGSGTTGTVSIRQPWCSAKRCASSLAKLLKEALHRGAGHVCSSPSEISNSSITVIDDATTSTRPAAASACCGLGRLLRGDERLPLMYRFNWFKQRAAYGLRRVQRVDSVDPQAVGSQHRALRALLIKNSYLY